MEHNFTSNIKTILNDCFGAFAEDIFSKSLLIQYINLKTKSANRGSKSRGSFANLYAIYVIIEDYINLGFVESNEYSKYDGAQYANLLKRQRELPFGNKLQNHALNNRMNSEFQKFFPTSDIIPILRDLKTNRYWFNENLIITSINGSDFNIANAVILIIDEYIKVKQDSFERFITQCETLQNIDKESSNDIYNFIFALLEPNVDARLFEIVSYSIIKFYYKDKYIIWGYDMDSLNYEELKLYKTGRTNANDGGIDFVMKPLGRFYQVTETLDFKKYFLDIEKIEKYPITFVIKSEESIQKLQDRLRDNALKLYRIESIVKKYMMCIEELINIPTLRACFDDIRNRGLLNNVLSEIIIQSKVEFNYTDEID
ncbi:MAG: restriction endonuclease [Rikenellaceae bacterium]